MLIPVFKIHRPIRTGVWKGAVLYNGVFIRLRGFYIPFIYSIMDLEKYFSTYLSEHEIKYSKFLANRQDVELYGVVGTCNSVGEAILNYIFLRHFLDKKTVLDYMGERCTLDDKLLKTFELLDARVINSQIVRCKYNNWWCKNFELKQRGLYYPNSLYKILVYYKFDKVMDFGDYYGVPWVESVGSIKDVLDREQSKAMLPVLIQPVDYLTKFYTYTYGLDDNVSELTEVKFYEDGTQKLSVREFDWVPRFDYVKKIVKREGAEFQETHYTKGFVSFSLKSGFKVYLLLSMRGWRLHYWVFDGVGFDFGHVLFKVDDGELKGNKLSKSLFPTVNMLGLPFSKNMAGLPFSNVKSL